MSVQDALRFIQEIGENDTLKDKIRGGKHTMALEDVVAIGRQAGFEFTSQELRTAFARDWAVRRLFYSAQARE